MATVPSQFPPREARSIEQYQAEVLGLVRPDGRVESVPLAAASGRVLARDVVSPVSIPVFANSAMDGYAVARTATARSVRM